jgi:hypothetical protein
MLVLGGSRAAVLACALLIGCNREHTIDASRPSKAVHASASAATIPTAVPAPSNSGAPLRRQPLVPLYPRAAWRLADRDALAPVVLWFSHIVIRHAESRPTVSFNPAYWSSVSDASRTREAALELAQQVAAEAARNPALFPELARQYSEDLPSRDQGGALGGMSAKQLAFWPPVMDALAALKPGEVSRVVETAYGFHVFCRSLPPVRDRVSAAHIVIGHEQAPWLEVFARGARPHRTRAEALTRANEVYRQALAEPDRFAALVERYSEHRDAVAEGDFGAWSTREPNPYPPRVWRARQLAVGSIAAPVETHLGFEIIQRTPERVRSRYRAALLVFPVGEVNVEAPKTPDAAARASALERARAALELFGAEPARFDGYDAQSQVVDWEEGRENHELTAALAKLQPGRITPAPVDTEDGIVIARRLELQPQSAQEFESELPAPNERQLAECLAAQASASALFLESFGPKAARELSLGPAKAERLASLHRGSGVGDNESAEGRKRRFGELFEHVRELLGADLYLRYQVVLAREAAAKLLPGSANDRFGL